MHENNIAPHFEEFWAKHSDAESALQAWYANLSCYGQDFKLADIAFY